MGASLAQNFADKKIPTSIYNHHPEKIRNLLKKADSPYLGGNESPLLLPFRGDPLEAKVSSVKASEIVESLYDAIGPRDGNNYRVAAAVMMRKQSGLEVAVINRSNRGE